VPPGPAAGPDRSAPGPDPSAPGDGSPGCCGIILAGGSGTRLWPVTTPVCKQLLPVYDKPMVYYPLSVLMLAGVRDVLVISTPEDLDRFERLLGDGAQLGCRFSYLAQPRPEGLAQAFTLGAGFIDGRRTALVLGDNIFHGSALRTRLRAATGAPGAVIFAYHVADPTRYGVVVFDRSGRPERVVEKPAEPISSFAVPGLYVFPGDVAEVAGRVRPSARGEYEITDVINAYLERGELEVTVLDRGTAWLDTGTFTSLMQAAQYVQVVEERQGLKVGCPEEVAWREGYIGDAQLAALAEPLRRSGYGEYLMGLLAGPRAWEAP
jgi:glucose-1-phosphate thymidylyltransferase